MGNVTWKAFKIGSIFERSTKLALSVNQKDLNLVEYKDNEHSIALISASRDGSGRVGYIENNLVKKELISKNKITFDDQWGYTFFQQEDFVITGGHNAILEIKDINLKYVLDLNLSCYSFISLILNQITIKSGIYGYGFKINNKLDREIVLLPCIEVSKDEEHIWEENGHCYTLAVDYIKKLMDMAKEEREKNTIRLYEAERAKYEAERAKYEAERAKYEKGYKKEKDILVWKAFTLDSLFSFVSSNQLSSNKKALNVSPIKNTQFTVALITQSEKNNGISGYLEESDEIRSKKMNGYLTYSMHFGLCFFHDYDFVLMDTHGSLFRLIPKNDKLFRVLNRNRFINLYFGKSITKICSNGIYNYNWLPNSTRVGREIILLPCLEISSEEESIWEENGHYYTLAADYISYLYLSGRVNYNQKLIDAYTYSY